MDRRRHEECTLESDGRVELHVKRWLPRTLRGTVILVHGLAEHGGVYRETAEALAREGFAVYTFDQQGHGRSGGQRGHIARFASYVEDVHRVASLARSSEPEPPLFVVGHSLGGLVALRYALTYPDALRGVIAIAPALAHSLRVPLWKKLLGLLLSWCWPTASASNEVEATTLSSDPAMVAAYVTDPLIHNRGSARFFTEITSAMAHTMGEADRLDVPLLLLHGTADEHVPISATRIFFRQVGVSDKQLIEYPDFYHALLHERLPLRQRVLGDIVAWLEARTSPTGVGSSASNARGDRLENQAGAVERVNRIGSNPQ